MLTGPLAEPSAHKESPVGPFQSKFLSAINSSKGRKASLLYTKFRDGLRGTADVLTTMQQQVEHFAPHMSTYGLTQNQLDKLRNLGVPSVIQTISHVANNLPSVPELNAQAHRVDEVYDTFKELAWDQVKNMIPTPPIPFGGAIKNFVLDNASKVGPYVVDEVMDMRSPKGNLVWNIVLEHLFGNSKKPIKTSVLR